MATGSHGDSTLRNDLFGELISDPPTHGTETSMDRWNGMGTQECASSTSTALALLAANGAAAVGWVEGGVGGRLGRPGPERGREGGGGREGGRGRGGKEGGGRGERKEEGMVGGKEGRREMEGRKGRRGRVEGGRKGGRDKAIKVYTLHSEQLTCVLQLSLSLLEQE